MTNANKLRVARWRCENDFLFFTRYFFKQLHGERFIINQHHEQIADALMRVHRGEITRLIINMPPRYGKTELAVVNFIAWCLAKNPRSKFIHLSYSDDLVLDNSSKTKDVIAHPQFQQFWPTRLRADSQSKKKWYTVDGGGVYATSAGGAVTGFGAGSASSRQFSGAIIIDDPLKPDDAESDTLRNAVNRRMNTTIKSRLNSRDTPIIVIMQRIHDDDMSGFCLAGGTEENWTHLKIPARLPGGTPMWPHKHTAAELAVLERADRYSFSGQYQQEPIPDEGIYFVKDSFNWYDTLPAHLNFYGASDYAVTEGAGDCTEHGVFGVCPDGNVYIVDWWTGQEKADIWIEQQLDLIQRYKTLKWAGETGPIKSAVEPWLTRRMRERRVYTVMEWFNHARGSKQANARSFQALVEAGRVYLPRTPWATELLTQLCRFPLAKFDDKVDACSLFGRMINDLWASEPTDALPRHQNDSYYIDEPEDDSWLTV